MENKDMKKGAATITPARTLEENLGRVKPNHRPENFQKIRKDFEKHAAQES